MRLRCWWLCCWIFALLHCKGSVDRFEPDDEDEDEEIEAFEDDEGETVPDDGCDLEDADFETDAFA